MDVRDKLIEQCVRAREASRILAATPADVRNAALENISRKLEVNIPSLLSANDTDMSHASENGVKDVMLDRLKLTESRIAAIANAMRKVIALPDPLGHGEVWEQPNGLEIRRVKVPLGVIGMIYEARPNVTVDAAALCIKSGNAVILRGGKAALNSNKALAELMKSALEASGLSGESVQLIEDATREGASALMRLNGYVDLLIPRGGESLIKSIVENSSVPVIETGAGNCHVYVDSSADLDMACRIVFNAKCQRPSVCNSAETLLVHKDVAEIFLPMAKKLLDTKNTELYGDSRAMSIIPCVREAAEVDYFAEYNDYKMAVAVVDSLDAAIAHINKYNTKHSDAIVTSNMEAAKRFQQYVDAAAVYVNTSTRFTDGEVFGFGAEIGIATGKLHARGPFGLNELTTVKYLINSDGQVRN